MMQVPKLLRRHAVFPLFLLLFPLPALLFAALLPSAASAQAQPGAPLPAPARSQYVAQAIPDLPDPMIWTIAFAPDGKPWVGTHAGGAVLTDGAWQWLTAEDGLGGKDVNAYLWTPDGRMWVGTDRSIDLFAGGEKIEEYTWDDGLAASSAEDFALDAAGNLWAAHLAEGVSRFDGARWRKYTTADGLADNWVYAIELDAAGGLWFGTLGGVSRYARGEWTTFTTSDGLADLWVPDIAAGPDGRLWFATHAGLNEYDGVVWRTHLAGRHVAAVAVAADGLIWAAGNGFVSRFDGDAWYDVQPELFDHQSLTALALGPGGTIWVGSLNDGATILTPSTGAAPDAAASAETLWLGTQAGVAVLAGTEQQRYGTDYGLAGEDVRAVLIDSQGRKWFGTEGGVTMYDGFGWTSYFPSFASISSNYVARVAVDPQGRTWFTYGDRGLGVSVQDGDEWQQYTEADGLGSDRVYSSAFGLHGETWLGTARGVSQWNSTRWTDLSTGIGAPNGAITALAVSPAGFLWAGFDGGVARYDGRRWTTYGASDGLDATAVTAIVFDDAGRVWAAAAPDPDSSRSGGLFVFEDGGWRPVPPNRASNGVSGPAAMPLGDNITDLAVDGAGRVWVGAHAYAMAKPGFVAGGVSVLPDTLAAAVTPDAAAAAAPGDATLWTIYTPAAGLLSDYVTALAVDAQDHVWIGTEQGLAQFDGKSWTSFTTANGLPHNHVTDLASTPEGGLWVTTDGGGAVYYDGQAWTNLLTVGIADRVVNALAEGQDGSIWAATAGGVSRYAGAAWTAYTMLDGLAINDSRAVTVDGEGAVWIGGGADRYTGAGLSRFDGEDWTTYPLQDNMPYPNVSALAVAPDGSAWAVGYTPQQFTHASALFTYDGAQWVRKGGPGPLNDDAVYAFTIGADGRMWFGTDGSYDDKTLVVWDGLTWSAYAIGDAAADVHAIAFADEGRGWLGTDLGLAALDATPADLRVTWVEGMRKIAVQAIGVEQTATE